MDYSIERVAKSMTGQRERKGVSQAEAAKGANVARQTLSNYETGATGLSFENAWRRPTTTAARSTTSPGGRGPRARGGEGDA